MRSIRISHPYLLFPVAKAAPKRLLTLFPEENREQKLREFEVPFPREGEKPDFMHFFDCFMTIFFHTFTKPAIFYHEYGQYISLLSIYFSSSRTKIESIQAD